MYLMCLEFEDFINQYGELSERNDRDSNVVKEFNPSIRVLNYNEVEDYNSKLELQAKVFQPSYDLEKHIDNLMVSFGKGDGNGYFFYSNDSLVGSLDAEIFNEFIYFINFAVLEDYRGKGLGKCFMINSLIDVINTYGDRFDRIYLLVSKKNTRAKKLYESLGFKVKN